MFKRIKRFLAAIVVTGILVSASPLQGLPSAEATTWCPHPNATTVHYYVDATSGVDKRGCWGSSTGKPYQTVMAAINKINTYTYGPGGHVIIHYKNNGGFVNETVAPHSGIPYTITNWGTASVNSNLWIHGRALGVDSMNFSGSGTGITFGAVDYETVDITKNTFKNGAAIDLHGADYYGGMYLDMGYSNNVEIKSNTFYMDGGIRPLDALGTEGMVNILTNKFYDRTGTNQAMIKVDGSTATIQVNGNSFDGVAIDAISTLSGSMVVDNNTVTGQDSAQTGMRFEDINVISLENNVISGVGTGILGVGVTGAPSFKFIEKNRIDLSKYAGLGTVMSTGIYLENVDPTYLYHDGIVSNNVTGADRGIVLKDLVSAAATVLPSHGKRLNVTGNSFVNIEDTALLIKGTDADQVNKNYAQEASVGIHVTDGSTVSHVDQNNIRVEVDYGIVVDQWDGEFFGLYNPEMGSGDFGGPANNNMTIDYNNIDDVIVGIGVVSITADSISGNKIATHNDGIRAYGGDIAFMQKNELNSIDATRADYGVGLLQTSVDNLVSNRFENFENAVSASGTALVPMLAGNAFHNNGTAIEISNSLVETMVNNLIAGGEVALEVGSTAAFDFMYNTVFGMTRYSVDVATGSNGRFLNNVFSNSADLKFGSFSDVLSFDYNLFDTVLDFRQGTSAYPHEDFVAMTGMGLNDLNDSGFVPSFSLNDPYAGDYELYAGSYGVNTGNSSYRAPSTDFNASARPACAVYDRGAFELQNSTDNDADGLCADQEAAFGTSDSNVDSDADGLEDGDEFFVYFTDPILVDTDGDAYSDGDEVLTYGTDPVDASSVPNDADMDGFDDTWEGGYGCFDPLSYDNPASDYDADGLTNVEEYSTTLTDPCNEDSDADGLLDGEEVNTYSTDPLDVDTDGDLYDDGSEVSIGTDPLDSADYPTDFDGDGIDDYLDTDDDDDGVLDGDDSFPYDASESVDTDGDGIGNNADTDDDGDGVADASDAFPLDSSESVDTDGDGSGNNADTDDDNDGVLDADDDLPLDSSESVDTDGDGTGNNADTDDDGDGVADGSDAFPLDSTESVDTDGDGTGNNADTDDDGDGVADGSDAFPLDSTESVDTDGDGIGNNADTDDDGDGVADGSDAFPLDSSESVDTDGDGTGNNADTDDDGDGVADGSDAFPLDSSESVDTDGDGTGNNADTDDDDDGYTDSVEVSAGTDPLDSSSHPTDCDTDGIPDADETAGIYGYVTDECLNDTDGDGLDDYEEQLTYSSDPTDTDSDDDGVTDGDEIDVYGIDPNDNDSDGDNFRDGYEVDEGVDPADAGSSPSLDVTLVGAEYVTGLGTSAYWITSTFSYTRTFTEVLVLGDTHWVELNHSYSGAVGVDWNEDDYYGEVSFEYCGRGTSAADPRTFTCTPAVDYYATTSPDSTLTSVTSSSLLEAWSYLSSYYTFSDWLVWYRLPTASSSYYYWVSFELT